MLSNDEWVICRLVFKIGYYLKRFIFILMGDQPPARVLDGGTTPGVALT